MDDGQTFDTFAPIGPDLVTTEDVPDPHNLAFAVFSMAKQYRIPILLN